MAVALFILSIVGTLVGVQVSRLVKAHRFEKEISRLFTSLQEAQILAVTYQTDFSLDLFVEKGKLKYRFSSDEPLAKAVFSQEAVPFVFTTAVRFNNKKIKAQHLDIYSSGSVEPRGILAFGTNDDGKELYFDLQQGALLKFCHQLPVVLKQSLPSRIK